MSSDQRKTAMPTTLAVGNRHRARKAISKLISELKKKKKVTQVNVLDSHGGDRVATLNWGEGGSERISLRKGHLRRA